MHAQCNGNIFNEHLKYSEMFIMPILFTKVLPHNS